MEGSRSGSRGDRCGTYRAGTVLLIIGVLCSACGAAAGGGPGGGPTDGGAAQDSDGQTAQSVRGPFPIVLCHGMGGFESIGPLNYFYGVADHLRDLGHQVFTTQVPMFASSAQRAQALAPQIDRILAETGAPKVNLIGHSQGGLDIRYLVSSLGYAAKVASITTIATPHRGTRIADVVVGLVPDPGYDIVDQLIQLFDAVIGQNGLADLQASLANMTSTYMRTVFNPENPDAAGVRYFSFAGVCQTGILDEQVVDRCDLPLRPTYEFMQSEVGPNDGLVSLDSARWGEYRATLAADHLDQVGQIGGIVGPSFDRLTFFATHAQFLVSQGF